MGALRRLAGVSGRSGGDRDRKPVWLQHSVTSGVISADGTIAARPLGPVNGRHHSDGCVPQSRQFRGAARHVDGKSLASTPRWSTPAQGISFCDREQYRPLRGIAADSGWPDPAKLYRCCRSTDADPARDRPLPPGGRLVWCARRLDRASKSATRGGLQEGDIIVALAGVPVSGVDDLHRLLTEDLIGVETSMTVLRRGRRQNVRITPAESRSANGHHVTG